MPARRNGPFIDPEPDQLAQCGERYGRGTDSHTHSEITDQLPVPTLTLTNKCEHNKQTTVDHRMFEENQEQEREDIRQTNEINEPWKK